MTRRRIISATALAAALAVPASAGAQATPAKDCLRFDSSDKREIKYTLAGSTLTLTPREAGEFLRLKASKRKSVSVTKAGDTDVYTFDVRSVDGETFKVVRERSKGGKLRLRVAAVNAAGDTLTRFKVHVKAFDEVVCKRDEADEDEGKDDDDKGDKDDDDKGDKDDDDKGDKDKSRGRGRGPESDEERKTRKERGEGRGRESDEEREDRKNDDD